MENINKRIRTKRELISCSCGHQWFTSSTLNYIICVNCRKRILNPYSTNLKHIRELKLQIRTFLTYRQESTLEEITQYIKTNIEDLDKDLEKLL